MRKRPMCLACLGFMLVLVLLRIAGVPLGTPFSDPKYEKQAQQGSRVWIAGTIETYEKKSSNNGYVLRGGGSKGQLYLLAPPPQSGEICRSEPLCGCTEL